MTSEAQNDETPLGNQLIQKLSTTTLSKKNHELLKLQHGFTAVELLIALTVSGIIMGFGYQGYHFFQSNFKQWQDRVLVEENARRVMQAMVHDFRAMRALLVADETQISFLDANRRMVTYAFDRQTLTKNNRPILNRILGVRKLTLRYHTPNGKYTSSFGGLQHISRIRIELVLLTPNQTTFELTSSVTLRHKRGF